MGLVDGADFDISISLEQGTVFFSIAADTRRYRIRLGRRSSTKVTFNLP